MLRAGYECLIEGTINSPSLRTELKHPTTATLRTYLVRKNLSHGMYGLTSHHLKNQHTSYSVVTDSYFKST